MRGGGSLAALACAAVFLAPGEARGQGLKAGLRGGYYFDVEEPFVGGELLVRVARRLYFNPNFEWVFVDNVDYWTLNGDFHYDLPTRGSTYVWLGAGLGLLRIDPDGPPEGDTDAVANFLAGVGVDAGGVIPYLQGKVIAGARGGSEFSLAFGLRF